MAAHLERAPLAEERGALANVELWQELDALLHSHQSVALGALSCRKSDNQRVDRLCRVPFAQVLNGLPTNQIGDRNGPYENILVETHGRVACALNRPKALNALNGPLLTELMGALETFDHDPDIVQSSSARRARLRRRWDIKKWRGGCVGMLRETRSLRLIASCTLKAGDRRGMGWLLGGGMSWRFMRYDRRL